MHIRYLQCYMIKCRAILLFSISLLCIEMKRSGHIAGRIVAALLLLVFSVTVTPLDALHRHAPEPVCAAADGSTCKHKQHLTQKSSFSLLCAVHHDQLIAPASADRATLLPGFRVIFPELTTGDISVSSPRPFLRGPPEDQAFISWFS